MSNTNSGKYTPCDESSIPAGVRFDVPRHLQGQIVEVAYGGISRSEHGPGDLYKRVTDRSVGAGFPGRVTYYRLVNVREVRS